VRKYLRRTAIFWWILFRLVASICHRSNSRGNVRKRRRRKSCTSNQISTPMLPIYHHFAHGALTVEMRLCVVKFPTAVNATIYLKKCRQNNFPKSIVYSHPTHFYSFFFSSSSVVCLRRHAHTLQQTETPRRNRLGIFPIPRARGILNQDSGPTGATGLFRDRDSDEPT
jgi:hypothetical protein